ncbi:unnamed protein product, partial [Thelazia callipaeda]|uniref:UMA domain-containing protein n=1 Tax=Thelazia callipaeda TaxID=103827 RepID=A0A0N5CQW4_THECL
QKFNKYYTSDSKNFLQRRRPKKTWKQETDVYTGLEKVLLFFLFASDRELPPSNSLSDGKIRNLRSDESDNPYRHLYRTGPYVSSSEFAAQPLPGGPLPVPSIVFEIEQEPTRTWYYCRWTVYWILWLITLILVYFLIFRSYYCPLLVE